MLAYESGAANTIDPLGGSYFIEALTDEMERQAEVYFKRIDEIGGVIPAIEAGFFQKEIADAAFRYQQELEQKRRLIIGVNEFMVDEEAPIDILRIDPRLESEQSARVQEVRRKRDQAKCSNALNRLRKAAAGTDNLMPYILEAVREYATEGEIMQAMIEVFGTYTETAVV
jgi:methylmalonyl-CoA mutase N-terminal domain/subunit